MFAGSAEGISPQAIYLEVSYYYPLVGYNMFLNNPISVYGENIAVLVQNFIILLLVWAYTKKIGFLEKLAVLAIYGAEVYVFLLGGYPLDAGSWQKVMTGVSIVMSLSRVPQVISNFKNKSTGHLSFITFFLQFAGCAARVFTVLKETDDFMSLFIALTAVFWNGLITLQIIMYWSNTKAKQVSSTSKPASGKKKNKSKID